MEYLEVFIDHNIDKLANIFYMELDEERNQIRVVEKHRNGNIGYADLNHAENEAFLAKEKYPIIEDINDMDECIAKKISKEKFEKVWELALKQSKKL